MNEPIKSLKNSLKYYKEQHAKSVSQLLQMTKGIITAREDIANAKKRIKEFEDALKCLKNLAFAKKMSKKCEDELINHKEN